jgi:hypothetical protein
MFALHASLRRQLICNLQQHIEQQPHSKRFFAAKRRKNSKKFGDGGSNKIYMGASKRPVDPELYLQEATSLSNTNSRLLFVSILFLFPPIVLGVRLFWSDESYERTNARFKEMLGKD